VKPDPENIKMVDSLAVIEYSDDYVGLEECAKKCPTNAIAYNLNPIH
jgi:NAD-dependent dihydropyrimidine dehydrogenase PreA subunit